MRCPSGIPIALPVCVEHICSYCSHAELPTAQLRAFQALDGSAPPPRPPPWPWQLWRHGGRSGPFAAAFGR
eukprot:3685083-Pleurochrysis_carterae.AAC.2